LITTLEEAAISRFLGLDVGDARIGLALSDPLGILASPHRIITRKNSPEDYQAISDIAGKNDVARIVVGLPVNMDGSMGIQVEKVQEFVRELKKYTDLPVDFKDERLSTVVARHIVQNVRKTNKNTRYDAAAAALILQAYLDDMLPPREINEDEPEPGA